MLSLAPSLHAVDPAKATLLGSPNWRGVSLNTGREAKVEQLETLGSRLKQLRAHDALCLLQNALAIRKVLYILRTAPSFRSPALASFDCVLQSLLESICNICLSDQNWTQVSLPIHLGGLGIGSVTILAPTAFLASAAGTSSVVPVLLPPTSLPVTCPHQD